jgi:hypothetical protein
MLKVLINMSNKHLFNKKKKLFGQKNNQFGMRIPLIRMDSKTSFLQPSIKI